MTPSLTCPFPPCINPLARPIPQLGAIDVFRERGLQRLPRRYALSAPAHDQRPLLPPGIHLCARHRRWPGCPGGRAIRPRCRTPTPPTPNAAPASPISGIGWCFPGSPSLGLSIAAKNGWEESSTIGSWPGLYTVGSGRPVNATVQGDANQDGNSHNDRFPERGRNSFLGPDYATTDMRLTRRLYLRRTSEA